MSESGFFAVGFSLMLIASRVAFVWRKRMIARRRRLGGVIVILAPLFSFIAFTIAAAILNIVHPLSLRSPEVNTSDIETYLELASMLALFFTPFWSFGALCGYMLRSLIDRPLRL